MTPEEFATLNRYLQTPNGAPPSGPIAQPMVRTPVFAAPDPTGVQAASQRGLSAIRPQQQPQSAQGVQYLPYTPIGTDKQGRPVFSDAQVNQARGYISQAAIARGIDPAQAIRVAQSEGLNHNLGAGGDGWKSGGAFQLYTGGGLGNLYEKQTGHSVNDPTHLHDQIDFALDQAKSGGWGPWHGWKGDPWAGIQRGAGAAYSTVADAGHAAYDKGAAAVNYASALPTRAYNAGASALGLPPAVQPISSSPGWKDASGQMTGTPFGAVSNTAYSTQGMSGPGAFLAGLSHPVGGQGLGGAQGLIPTLINGVTSALAQLFGVTPAEASPAQKQVAVQAVQQQAPAVQPKAATPAMQPISPPTQNPVAVPAPAPAAPQMGAPQPQLAFGRSPMPTGANVLGRPLSPGSDIMNPTRLGGAQPTPPAQPQVWEVTSGPPDASKVPVPLPPSQQPPEPAPAPIAKAPDLPKPTEMPTMNSDNLFGLVMSDTASAGLGF